MNKASEAILALKPVTFQYKSDGSGAPQFGLIAEEVAAVNPDLVVRDDNGQIYTVRYDAINTMLLNGFLKEHRKLEEQTNKIQEQDAIIRQLQTEFHATLARQQMEIIRLAASLQRQARQTDPVNAHSGCKNLLLDSPETIDYTRSRSRSVTWYVLASSLP
jgi:hypothetical protein